MPVLWLDWQFATCRCGWNEFGFGAVNCFCANEYTILRVVRQMYRCAKYMKSTTTKTTTTWMADSNAMQRTFISQKYIFIRYAKVKISGHTKPITQSVRVCVSVLWFSSWIISVIVAKRGRKKKLTKQWRARAQPNHRKLVKISGRIDRKQNHYEVIKDAEKKTAT